MVGLVHESKDALVVRWRMEGELDVGEEGTSLERRGENQPGKGIEGGEQ